MASADGLTSIAFPAIGTGYLQFPHGLAARAMFDEVKVFSSATPQTSISNILFVIYNTDTITLNVSAVIFVLLASYVLYFYKWLLYCYNMC